MKPRIPFNDGILAFITIMVGLWTCIIFLFINWRISMCGLVANTIMMVYCILSKHRTWFENLTQIAMAYLMGFIITFVASVQFGAYMLPAFIAGVLIPLFTVGAWYAWFDVNN